VDEKAAHGGLQLGPGARVDRTGEDDFLYLLGEVLDLLRALLNLALDLA
jgi:hypothetical protein